MKRFYSIHQQKIFGFTLNLVFCSVLLCIPQLSAGQKPNPVAVRDTASVLQEIPVTVNVLKNDYDPDGDHIWIFRTYYPLHGWVTYFTDSSITYVSNYYTGMDSLSYYIKDVHGNYSDPAYLVINCRPNQSLPYAMPDSATAMACDPVYINVRQNDSDPLGDPIEIDPGFSYNQIHAHLVRMNDSIFEYTASSYFSGRDTIHYRIRKKNDTTLYSNYCPVYIDVTANPNVPVAHDDEITYTSRTEQLIDVLANDINPLGDSLEIINDIVEPYPYFFAAITPDQKILYHDTIWNNNSPRILQYRVTRKSNHNYCSNLATIKINFQYNDNYFHANDDLFNCHPYQTISGNLVSNDHNPVSSDSLILEFCTGGRLTQAVTFTDSVFTYLPTIYNAGKDTVSYILKEKNGSTMRSTGYAIIDVANNSFEFLDINNVQARINPFGTNFFTFSGGADQGLGFFIPKNSGKSTIFSQSLWIGGKDNLDSLHFAGEKYRQGMAVSLKYNCMDYWAGPIMDTVNYSPVQDWNWLRVWKINRSDIDYHKSHWSQQGYTPIEPILNWPGNGDPALGQSALLAPFHDQNNDLIYDPMDGDYPYILGDQSVFFLYNDDRGEHLESHGEKVRVEVHGWAYAFDLPNDSALKNTVFFHYEIFNRSQNTYRDTYLGCFTDFDIGWAGDDYIGCDVERNSFYAYNATPVDGNGESYAYGENPPAEAITLLGGPVKDANNMDDPKLDQNGHQLCNESILGLNYGDSIIDNERLGVGKFLYFNNSTPGVPYYVQDPKYASECYNFLTGKWKNGDDFLYGGNGYTAGGAYGPSCSFAFPGMSDSLDYGTGCNPPNGPKDWTEEIAGNPPADRRGLISMGPFTFHPGDRQVLDFAYVFGRSYSGVPGSSVHLLMENIDKITAIFVKDSLPDGSHIFGIPEETSIPRDVKIYPNPAKDVVTVNYHSNEPATIEITLLSLPGQVLLSRKITRDTSGNFIEKINVAVLENGVYLLRISGEGYSKTVKLVIKK